jgi:hypothetical protein
MPSFVKSTPCFQGYDSPRRSKPLNRHKPPKTKYCAGYLEHISGPHRGKHKQTKMARAQERDEKNKTMSWDDAESEFWDDDEFWY